MACAIVNPRSVRHLAEALGLLEKTDRIDAGVIAKYAEVKDIAGQDPASPTQKRLRELVARLRQLTDLTVAQADQRRFVQQPEALESIAAVVATLIRPAAPAIFSRVRERRPARFCAPPWMKAGIAVLEVLSLIWKTFSRSFSWQVAPRSERPWDGALTNVF